MTVCKPHKRHPVGTVQDIQPRPLGVWQLKPECRRLGDFKLYGGRKYIVRDDKYRKTKCIKSHLKPSVKHHG